MAAASASELRAFASAAGVASFCFVEDASSGFSGFVSLASAAVRFSSGALAGASSAAGSVVAVLSSTHPIRVMHREVVKA